MNYHSDCEAMVNKLINLDQSTNYVYQQMAWNFDRDDVALPGFYKFFKERSGEKYKDAEKFMKFQNARGGRIVLQSVEISETEEWKSGLAAMEMALALEKIVNQALLELHKLASDHQDGNLTSFIELNFMKQEVETIKLLAGFVTQLKRVGPGLGEYLFDKELGELVKKVLNLESSCLTRNMGGMGSKFCS